MNIKRLLFTALIAVLAFSYILPIPAQAAAADTTLSAGTYLYITDVAPTAGGTNGLNIYVVSDSTCESVIVNPTNLIFSLDAGSTLSFRSSDRKVFSSTVTDTVCTDTTSTWTYTSTTANESVTISFADSNNCPPVPSGGGGGWSPPAVTPEPEVPADESAGEGETTSDLAAGQSGNVGEVSGQGSNVLMGEGANASFTLSNPAGGAGGSHSVSVQNVTTNQATFTISSDPVVFTLVSGASKNVDVDGDGYRDMKITLNRIVAGKTDITIKEIAVVKISNALPGSLIKIASQTAVYYLGEDSRRYVFPNEKVFYSWYDNFNNVVTISDADMAKLPLGGLVTYRPGTWMVTFVTTPDVYTVTKGGILQKLKDEAMAADLYGVNWNQHIHDINDAFFSSYSFGADLQTASEYNQATQKSYTPTITVDKSI